MEQPDMVKAIMENLPAFFCAAEIDSGNILMINKAAANLFGDIKTIGEAGEVLEKGRLEYNSKIKGRWYWISHYPVTWAKGEKADIFIGIDYSRLRSFESLLEEDAFAESLKGPINALDKLERQVNGYKNGSDAFTVCYLDADCENTLSDVTGGNAYIDAVIKVVKASIRKSDKFIHIGGDDFLIIFPKCSQAVVENILTTVVKKLDIMSMESKIDGGFSLSYGILEVNAPGLANVDIIMSTIRQRMKAMKDTGSSRYFYNPPDKFTTSPAI